VVPKAIVISGRLFSLALSTAVLACESSDLTLPGDGQPSSLREVSGSGQQGTVGSALPGPLVVKLTDAAGQPLSQVSLRFQTAVPGAEIRPSELTTTNDTGYAQVRVLLGDTEGIQTFHAQVADASDLSTTFEVIAFAKQPTDNGGNGGGGQGGGGDGGGAGNGNGSGNDGHGNDDDNGHGQGDDGGDD